MGGPPGSQAAPLPKNLPFRLISKTIGSGAYASIRKAIPPNAPSPVIAIKFINKEHAFRSGRLRPKQLELEIALHNRVSGHHNVIQYMHSGSDDAWVYICMELAEGGDLFDKIEADEGVGEDIAHFYFSQLIAAIDWCHGRGVAHRDIKPENMLLNKTGDLKLADFGLATQFLEPRTGQRKTCATVCGSPPYIAPEILSVGQTNQKKRKTGDLDKTGYDPQIADVWSCAIVLFVLLVGNTPWDAPVTAESYEFYEYVQNSGKSTDELWSRVPPAALSLLRGTLNVDTNKRFTVNHVRTHPWFTRPNSHLDSRGRAADPINLATEMLKRLTIDLDRPIHSSQMPQSQRSSINPASNNNANPTPANGWAFAATQPETPLADINFDWESAPHRISNGFSASQPTLNDDNINIRVLSDLRQSERPPTTKSQLAQTNRTNDLLQDLYAEDPSMSQFQPTPSVPLSLTQQARKFNDIVPSHSLARFVSELTASQLLPILQTALHRLNIPIAASSEAIKTFLEGDNQTHMNDNSGGPESLEDHERYRRLVIPIKTTDIRRQPLHGHVAIERIALQSSPGNGVHIAGPSRRDWGEILEVRLVKAKGDPLGWRRLFKNVARLCREAIIVPH